MCIIRQKDMSTKPDWCKMTAYGIYRRKKGEPTNIEYHFHDCDEYWFMVEGKIRVQYENEEYIINAGDVFCTPMGKQHSLLEILDDCTIVWFEDELKGQKRLGHLHESDNQ